MPINTRVAAARKKIEQILAEAKKGSDFVELAQKYSEGPSAPKGGELGFLPRGRLVKSFEEAAFALKPGETSNVVRTHYGFHIIKLEARRRGVLWDVRYTRLDKRILGSITHILILGYAHIPKLVKSGTSTQILVIRMPSTRRPRRVVRVPHSSRYPERFPLPTARRARSTDINHNPARGRQTT